MKTKEFIVARFMTGGTTIIVLDYPKSYPIPLKGEKLIMEDRGKVYQGVINERIFTQQEGYREILLIVTSI